MEEMINWGNDIPTYDTQPEKTGEKLDIFQVLGAADTKQRDFYKNLSPELKKQFSPLVVMQWFSCVDDKSKYASYYLEATNEVLNKQFWHLKDHPELQWLLMAACGCGQKVKHQWIPMPKRKKISNTHEYMLTWYPSANNMELDLIINSMSLEDFQEFVKSTGATDEEYISAVNDYEADKGLPISKLSKKKKK